MGIPAYMGHILKTYPDLIKTLKFHYAEKTCFDSLFLDSNSIIYDVFNRIKQDWKNKDTILIEFISQRKAHVRRARVQIAQTEWPCYKMPI